MVIAFRDAHVATHAVAAAGRGVLLVIKQEVLARFCELGERGRRRVTAETGALVVRLHMAADACCIVGNVERERVCIDVRVAAGARDAGRGMFPMRERLRPAAREPEHAGTRRECETCDHDGALHRAPQRRPS
ncbi:MAG: hypothetical protein JWO36_5973 [Myxococcales bacterium]|nr:hypothetical protein [Myxococcales bacterium]